MSGVRTITEETADYYKIIVDLYGLGTKQRILLINLLKACVNIGEFFRVESTTKAPLSGCKHPCIYCGAESRTRWAFLNARVWVPGQEDRVSEPVICCDRCADTIVKSRPSCAGKVEVGF